MKTDFRDIYKKAIHQDRLAQKEIYEIFAPKMLAIAHSYTSNIHDAEDVLMQAFCKAFKKLETCKSAELFPAWLRRIVVNEAISFIRKNKHLLYIDRDISDDTIYDEEMDIEENWNIEDIISEMPLGYKTIFNLFVFEEKKHIEIAQLLNISESTSKSQLMKAKKWLREFLLKHKSNEK